MKPTRRNVAHVSQAERDKLVNAIVELDRSKLFADGVSFWDKQDQIYQSTHVHSGPASLPWHRELLNRFEAMLQAIDPTVALHYWDWTSDPRNAPDGQGGFINLFTSSNFGSSSGRAGAPFDTLDNGGTLAGSRNQTGRPSDPPQEIIRHTETGNPPADADTAIITSADSLPQEAQWAHFRTVLQSVRNRGRMHSWVGGPGGTISSGHSPFEDPFVFMMHSNTDRIWAMWQTVPGQEWRLDPDQVYGDETDDAAILEALEPWSGTVHVGSPVPPWDPSDPHNEIVVKTSRHISVVIPPRYETFLPTGRSAQGDDMQPGEVLNPGQSISSENRQCTFRYQSDGNLVLYRNRDGEPLWSSETAVRSAGVCIMQGDGNLVIYGVDGEPVWASDTGQHPGSQLIVQDDGNAVIYRSDGLFQRVLGKYSIRASR